MIGDSMNMKLTNKQIENRAEVLKTMIKVKIKNEQWLTFRQAVDEVSEDLENDPILLKYINALAASTTT